MPAPQARAGATLTNAIKFGTDGWRAIIAEDFTFDNVRACAQSVAQYLKEAGLRRTRAWSSATTRASPRRTSPRPSPRSWRRTASRSTSCDQAGADAGRRATPSSTSKAGGAIVITASHNPAQLERLQVQAGVRRQRRRRRCSRRSRRHCPTAVGLGGRCSACRWPRPRPRGLVEMFDPQPPYLAQLGQLVDLERLRAAGLQGRRRLRCTARAWATFGELLAGGTTQVRGAARRAQSRSSRACTRPEPIARNLAPTGSAVRREKADVGLATDGDADRFGVRRRERATSSTSSRCSRC